LDALREGRAPEKAFDLARYTTRDRCRTPMQWGKTANGGFSPLGVTPWLPVNPNCAQGVNVADQENDADSLLSFYRDVIALRQRTPALHRGEQTMLVGTGPEVLAYLRETEGERLLVAINYAQAPAQVELIGLELGTCLFSTATERTGTTLEPASLLLAPEEMLVARLT
jgi:alpha-glucosidase